MSIRASVFHRFLPILHKFPSYCTSSLLLLGLFGLFLTLVCNVCSAFFPSLYPLVLKSLGIPGQRHVKAIRRNVSEVFFSGHWGESKRLQSSVTKTSRCCGSVLYLLPHWHTWTNLFVRTHTCTSTTHDVAVTHIMACKHIHRQYDEKTNIRNLRSLYPSPIS